MEDRYVSYGMEDEELERLRGWYLSSRDRFVVSLVRREFRAEDPENISILDVGCGTGGVTFLLSKHGYQVTSVDADPQVLLWGEKSLRLARPVLASITELPFPDRHFDLCVCSEVVEHVPDHSRALSELLRVCRRGVLITVPAHPYLWTDSDKILMHQRRYEVDSIRDLVSSASGQLRKVHAYAVIPALCVLAYKAMGHLKHMMAGKGDSGKQLPLSVRHSLPAWLNHVLALLFRGELTLSCLGLVPWGHGYWFVVDRLPADNSSSEICSSARP